MRRTTVPSQGPRGHRILRPRAAATTWLAALAAVLCLAPAAGAESAWKGDAELGVVMTGGNTETESINAKAKAVNERERWRHTGTFESLNTSDGGTTTAERYLITGKSDLKLSEANYLFGLVSYDKDRFNGFDYRVSETIGYGRRVLNSEALSLDLEAGAGMRQSKETATGDSDNEALGRLAGNLGWQVSGTSRFTEDVTVDIGESSTITRSVTGLKSQVNGALSTKITFTFRNTTGTPAGVKENDYETAVTLVYGFGG